MGRGLLQKENSIREKKGLKEEAVLGTLLQVPFGGGGAQLIISWACFRCSGRWCFVALVLAAQLLCSLHCSIRRRWPVLCCHLHKSMWTALDPCLPCHGYCRTWEFRCIRRPIDCDANRLDFAGCNMRLYYLMVANDDNFAGSENQAAAAIGKPDGLL